MRAAERVPEVQRVRAIRDIQYGEPDRRFRMISALQHLRHRQIKNSSRAHAAPIEINQVGAWALQQIGQIPDFERRAAFVTCGYRRGEASNRVLIGDAGGADMTLVVIRDESCPRPDIDDVFLEKESSVDGPKLDHAGVGVAQIRRPASIARHLEPEVRTARPSAGHTVGKDDRGAKKTFGSA